MKIMRSMALAGILATAFGTVGALQPCRQHPRGVAGWWPGDGSADDLTLSMNAGQLLGGATFGAGAIGQGFLLDGLDDRVDVPGWSSLTPSQFTLAAWIRLDAATEWACIICKQVGGTNVNSLSLWVNDGVLQGGMYGFAEAIAPSVAPINQFLHVAVSYDGSIIRLYQDGRLISVAQGPASPVPYDSSQVIIGADDNGASQYLAFFKGIIDEAQIFTRALSGCEVRVLADALPPGSCKGDSDADAIPDFQDNCATIANVAQQDADGDGVGDACDCAPSDASVHANPGDRNELRFTGRDRLDWCGDPSLTGASTVYDLQRGELSMLPVTSGVSQCRSHCVAPPAGLVGWWPGDGSTTDLVGGNNGVLQNGATYSNGWTRSAFSFDGVNDRVRTGNLTLGNTFTVTAWVNSDSVNQGSYQRIVETNYATGFYLGTDTSGARYKVIVRNAGAPYGTVNGGTISPGEWQFVAGTYDGTTGTLYVDGQQVASGAFTAPGTVTRAVNIGAFDGGGDGWKGRIDEVQIYNRSLAAGELRAIYEAGSAGACKAALGGVDAEWTVPFADDGIVPTPGHGFWYVYRGRNACGTGSYGSSTSGAERIGALCN